MSELKPLKAAIAATCLVATPIQACEPPSLQITMQNLADQINRACKCQDGSMALNYNMLHRTAVLRGMAGRYLDDRNVQRDLQHMNEAERGKGCNFIVIGR